MEKRICISTLLVNLVLLAFAASVFAADIQYRYDDLNRLVGVYYVNSQAVGYSYDEAGNRTALSVVSIRKPRVFRFKPEAKSTSEGKFASIW